MRILVCNDDGIYSPGIRTLARCAAAFGEVRVVAPDVEQSSMGHAITHSRPLRYRRTSIGDLEGFRVDGTPADCVALGLHAWGEVDLVLSGINLGLNLGNGAWHSGTLAAAKQASLLGVRGIAVSAPALDDEVEMDSLRPWVERVLELLIPQPTPELVNVNLPAEPHGIKWTRQSVRHYDGKVFPAEDPMGRPVFWITVRPLDDPEEGTDRWAVENGFVSITPLRLDLTDEEGLASLLV